MNKEQFFKAIDNVDDKLLKGVFDDIDLDNEKLTEAETLRGAAYRPEYRPRRRIFAAAAASLALVAGAGFAVKSLTTPNSGNSDGIVLSNGPAAFGPDDLTSSDGIIIKDPANTDDLWSAMVFHGFDEPKHLRLFTEKLKGTDYIRFPDGMFEEYDFSKVGEFIGNSLGLLEDGYKFYTFSGNEDFVVVLTDGKYVPYINEDVCDDYGVPHIDYSDEYVYLNDEEVEFYRDINWALMRANTVEELEQLLAECDTDNRIDGFVIYKNKKDYITETEIENPSGVFSVGMCIQVYWDNYSSHSDRKIVNADHREFVYPEPEPSRDNCYPEDTDNTAEPDLAE